MGVRLKLATISAWQRTQASSPTYFTPGRAFRYGEPHSCRETEGLVEVRQVSSATEAAATSRPAVKNESLRRRGSRHIPLGGIARSTSTSWFGARPGRRRLRERSRGRCGGSTR
jgi:hypothetical protein